MSTQRFDIDKDVKLVLKVKKGGAYRQRFRIQRKILTEGATWSTVVDWKEVRSTFQTEIGSYSAISSFKITGQHRRGRDDWKADPNSKILVNTGDVIEIGFEDRDSGGGGNFRDKHFIINKIKDE